MTVKEIDRITGYHAHIYFEPNSEADAQAVREDIGARFDVTLGSWHHKNVGPHMRSMYQVVFGVEQFSSFVPWLALNRRGLAILIHPESGDVLADHTDHALWMGEVLDVNVPFLKEFEKNS